MLFWDLQSKVKMDAGGSFEIFLYIDLGELILLYLKSKHNESLSISPLNSGCFLKLLIQSQKRKLFPCHP